MFSPSVFVGSVFNNNVNFDELAYKLFKYQYENNPLYHAYADILGVSPESIRKVRDIPFLPIRFFKSHEVKTGDFESELVFESSGTTGMTPSRHFVRERSLYTADFRNGFKIFYGNITEYVVIGLLPSYLERQHSSLVYMVNDMIRQSGRSESGFYLYEHEKLFTQLEQLEKEGRKTLLIGVTYALLDFAEKYSMNLQQTLVMETGGMKGRREEWTREQVHIFLKEKLGISRVHSEYGMTELLSQAYSQEEGVFHCPPWMRVLLRDENDPLQLLPLPEKEHPRQGIINVVDLANIYSCAFIATDDIGALYADGSFGVQGRIDNSDLRGCSMLVTS